MPRVQGEYECPFKTVTRELGEKARKDTDFTPGKERLKPNGFASFRSNAQGPSMVGAKPQGCQSNFESNRSWAASDSCDAKQGFDDISERKAKRAYKVDIQYSCYAERR